MTIEDLIESGVTLQGLVEVRVYADSKCVTVFDGDGEDVQREGLTEDWYHKRPLTFIYSHEDAENPACAGFVLEVDGEEED